MNYAERLKRLNVLDKLLKQDRISLKGDLGDSEVVVALNEEIKAFLLSTMESTFAGSGEALLTPSEQVVLKEMASKLIARIANPPTLPEPNMVGNPPVITVPKRPVSPVMKALLDQGYNPNAPIEERQAAIKNIEKITK